MSHEAPPDRSSALLPPDSGRDRPLFIVAAILVFLACIAALGARGAWRTAEVWTADLEQALTVQVRPVEDRITADDAEAVAQIARELDGVAAAEARSREDAEALLAPWLGPSGVPQDLPVPLLVDIRLSAPDGDLAERLQARIDEAGIPALVDDHTLWADRIASGARAAQWLGLSLLALAAGAAAAVIAFAARASLAARLDVADALHLVGAEDRFITGLFQTRFFMLGLKAGGIGAVAAGLVYLLVTVGGTAAQADYLLPRWVMAPFELILLALAPVLAGLTAAISARLAVAADLQARW